MLEVENLKKQYAAFSGRSGAGVLGVSFGIRAGEMFTLLGPSGCGKTTTLRAIAGLETPDSGRILLGGAILFDAATGVNVPVHARDMGMVFQSYAIWPHMSVFENAAYPLRVARRRPASSNLRKKVMAVLDMVGLADFAERPATQLSGGQQQRLALARAFTREPGLLLLDEPLSNLDAQLREQMRAELKRLQQETGVTAIYVTHDQGEALALSDRIAVMHAGRIVQIGTPRDIYARPASEFVANFVGRTNLLHGAVVAGATAPALARVTTPIGDLACVFAAASSAREASIVVRPEHIAIARRNGSLPPDPAINRLDGQVTGETYLGEIVEYCVAVGSGALLVRSMMGHTLATGDAVTLSFAAENTLALPPS